MRVAVVGGGAIGRRYLEWIRDLGHEVGGCDQDPERLRWIEQELGVPAFPNIADLLRWEPERTIISTPPDAHEFVARALIEAGIPILIEKPIAHTLASAEGIADIARSARAKVAVVCNMRFHVGVQAIRANLSRIGRPLCFRAIFGHRLSQMRKIGGEFAKDAAAGGGVVLDCIHEFDYLRWLFGPICDVRSVVGRIGEDRIDAEDFAEVILTFQSGLLGSLHLNFLMRQKRRGLEVIGTEGNLIWLSTGKAPEVARISFADQSGETVLLCDENVDQRQEYFVMLQRFLDGGELQSVDEAVSALEAALEARAGI